MINLAKLDEICSHLTSLKSPKRILVRQDVFNEMFVHLGANSDTIEYGGFEFLFSPVEIGGEFAIINNIILPEEFKA